tara:strand:- start:54 stop:599 length:546 start_codon:yes stop_codon:yes gene_type:complete
MKLSNIEADYIPQVLLTRMKDIYSWYSDMYLLPNKAGFYQEGLPKLQQAMMDSIVISLFAKLIEEDHKDTRWIKDNGGFLPLVKYVMPSYKGDAQTLLMSLRRYDKSNDRYYIAAEMLKNHRFYSIPKYGNDTDLKVWQAVRKLNSRRGYTPKALEKGIRVAHQIITGKKSDIRTVLKQTT